MGYLEIRGSAELKMSDISDELSSLIFKNGG